MVKIKKIIIIVALSIIYTLICSTLVFANTEKKEEISVNYNSHVQDVGWEKDFCNKDGQISGTQGQSKRLEAIKIKGNNLKNGAKIKYQVHIQDYGWQDWKQDGAIAGTTGESKRLEAIKIKLIGMPEYTIEYRVHVQDYGWQDWKQDGVIAGTTGESKRLEAIQIKIIKKQNKGEINVESNPDKQIFYENINISGWKMANVQDTKLKIFIDDNDVTNESNIQYKARYDLQEKTNYDSEINLMPGFTVVIKTNNIKSGTHKLKLQLLMQDDKTILANYIKDIKVDKNIYIKYQAHVQDVGWASFVENGQIAGTTGENKRLEAIKIKAINLPEGVKLKYQAHVQDMGWRILG